MWGYPWEVINAIKCENKGNFSDDILYGVETMYLHYFFFCWISRDGFVLCNFVVFRKKTLNY